MDPGLSTTAREEAGGVWVVRVGGELDIGTAGKLEAVLDTIRASKPSRVLLEFEDVAFVDSSGLRVVVAAKRDFEKGGATLTIGGMSGAVQQVFEVAGLLDSLAAHPDDD